MSKRIAIIIEDEKSLAQQLGTILTASNFECELYYNAEEFLLAKKFHQNCLYLLDLSLPGIQGKELINLIRVRDKFSPIFILSGNLDESKVTDVLRCGADDYVQKPYNPDHLLMKVNNAFNKMENILKDQLNVGIKLIPEADLVMREGKALKLTSKEFLIIELLLKDVQKIHTREELIDHLGTSEITARTIDVHVSGLRKKLEPIEMEIETIRGKGYRVIVKEPL